MTIEGLLKTLSELKSARDWLKDSRFAKVREAESVHLSRAIEAIADIIVLRAQELRDEAAK